VAARRIECISTKTRDGAKRITHIGGLTREGARWRQTQEEAIQAIESGESTYYCETGAQSYLVVVGKSGASGRILKAVIDIDEPDCLLKLPECP
jgi:hypothetical protein